MSYILYIWPSKWNLQSLDPTCLATVMYLQLTIPGKFKVVPCANPDQSPNGQLPFLTHGHTAVSTFPSIVAFVASLAKSSSASGAVDLDASLTSEQRTKKVALYAHVEACVGDLVSHMFYGTETNFWGLTNPALGSEMSVPQKYYVPGRIRETYRPRLEAAGLWKTSTDEGERKSFFEGKSFLEDKKKKRDCRVTFSRAFELEKITDKARTAMEIHANYLDGKPFFFGESPSSLDVFLAAHILLLADAPFPDAILQIHLIERYPGLVDHARRIQAAVARAPSYELSTAPWSLLRFLTPRSFGSSGTRTPVDPADIQYRRMSLLFAGMALGMIAVKIYTTLLLVSVSKKDDGDGEEGQAEEEEEEVLGASEAFSDVDEEE